MQPLLVHTHAMMPLEWLVLPNMLTLLVTAGVSIGSLATCLRCPQQYCPRDAGVLIVICIPGSRSGAIEHLFEIYQV
jgi:hypothetical protein